MSTTATACAVGSGAFELWPRLGLENDASHAFYMGVELAHAELAWRLGKRYTQDQPLDWGCAVEREVDNPDVWCAPGTTRRTPKIRFLTMNDQIFETVVTTQSPDGTPHVAPMGVRYQAGGVVLMPFKPSTTLSNVLATRHAVLNLITDSRVFAGCVTGRRSWPLLAAERIAGQRLACALGHVELVLEEHVDDAQRPVLRMARVHEASHAPFLGMNRAQAAVLEGAVLVSRLNMLSPEKVSAEMAYLQIAIDKTAGAGEHEAWGWLQAAVAAHREKVASR